MCAAYIARIIWSNLFIFMLFIVAHSSSRRSLDCLHALRVSIIPLFLPLHWFQRAGLRILQHELSRLTQTFALLTRNVCWLSLPSKLDIFWYDLKILKWFALVRHSQSSCAAVLCTLFSNDFVNVCSFDDNDAIGMRLAEGSCSSIFSVYRWKKSVPMFPLNFLLLISAFSHLHPPLYYYTTASVNALSAQYCSSACRPIVFCGKYVAFR